MYRDPPPSEELEAAGRDRELAYVPRPPEYGIASMPGFVPVFVGGGSIVAGTIVAAAYSPNLGAAVMVLGVAIGVASWRLLRRGPEVVLTVLRGELLVRQRAFVRARIAFHLLEDIVVDGDEHLACIIVVPEKPHSPIPLTAKNIARSDCIEWAAKMRAFLRDHGWKPADERPPVSSSFD